MDWERPRSKGTDAPSALGHLRVLDLTGPDGQYCGKLLADLGADVIKVEPPDGDTARRMAPFARDSANPEASLYFINYNTNKRSLVLDLTSGSGRRTFRSLVAGADVLLESFTPGYLENLRLGFKRLSRINRALVMTSITPFGQSGPRSGMLGSDLVAQAMGGLMYLQGEADRPPCAAPCDQASQLACLHAAYGTLAALHQRGETGRGQHVDVSMQEVIAHVLFPIPQYANSGLILTRSGSSFALAPNDYYRCKDGLVSLSVIFPHNWRVFVEWTGKGTLADPVWEDVNFRRSNVDIVEQYVSEFASGFTVEEFVREAQERHLAASPVSNLEDMVRSPQLKARGYFVNSVHPQVGEHRYPGAPYRFSTTPWTIRRPAPLLGQHQDEILSELRTANSDSVAATRVARRPPTAGPPLKDIRIVDFSRVWAGPFGTRYLGDLGAEVIKIETGRYLDTGRIVRQGSETLFPETNRSKLGVTLNFQDPRGLEAVQRLIAVSDVVVENFAAGVMDRRGLGYESLRKVKPDIIMVSMSGYGNTGPYSSYAAYGRNLMAYAGLCSLWRFPDSPSDALPKVHYADFVSAPAATTAIMAALEYRSRTGRGQFIEIAQVESLASTMGVALLDYLVNGNAWQPSGNRTLNAAPSGCYPCLGDDRWCAISCCNEEQWKALCEAMDNPSWTASSKFASMKARLRSHDELDEYIGHWTKDYTAHQLMRLLQTSGVPAGAVQSGEDLYHDYHLRSRNFIVEVDHPGWGVLEHSGMTVGLSGSPQGIVKGAPGLGQHNHLVFSDLLGIAPHEVDRLISDKVLA